MRRVIFCSSVVAVIAFGSPLMATTVLPLSLTDLLERSDVVARVRVGEVRLFQGERAPYRVTELRVIEGLAGASQGEVIELWQRGNDVVSVVGDPRLNTGDQGLAFLVRHRDRAYLTALAQSFWWLEGQGEELVARRDLSGLSFVAPEGEVRMPPARIEWERLRQAILDLSLGMSGP